MNIQNLNITNVSQVDMAMLMRIVNVAYNLKENPKPEGSKGGYLSLYGYDEKLLISVPAGDFPEEKRYSYLFNANEKVTRCLKEDIIRSFLSRDFDNGKYGGGVLLKRYAVAFSGFVELLDEAVSVVYGIYHTLRYSSGGLSDKDRIPEEVIEQCKEWQSKNAPDNPFCMLLAQAVFG